MSKFTVGRFLQSLYLGQGDPSSAAAFVASQGHWADRAAVLAAVQKAGVGALDRAEFPPEMLTISEAFIEAMRSYSVPERMQLRRVPLWTRIYVNARGDVRLAARSEGGAFPVLAGDWSTATLEPRATGAIMVQSVELMRSTSPLAASAITEDLASVVGESVSRDFCSPEVSGSVLFGAASFASSGSSAAAIRSDLQQLMQWVSGVWRPGAAFLMSPLTASAIHFSDPAGFASVGPMGGSIAGVPVLTTNAMQFAGSPPQRAVGLLSGSDIFFGDRGRALLDVSQSAALEQSDGPTQSSTTPTASSVVSMFQSGSVALRGVREAAWYARAGSAAYFTTSY